MKKLILFFTLSSTLFSAVEKNVALDIAKVEYGARSEAIKLIDNDLNTSEKIETFVVKLATETKLDKIDMKIKPSRGTLIFKTKVDNKEKYLAEIDTTENDEYVSFSLKEDEEEYREIFVNWIPSEDGKKLEVKEFGAYISEKETIKLYKQVAKYIVERKAPESQIQPQTAGEELVITERNMILPVNLPTEHTVSPSRITK